MLLNFIKKHASHPIVVNKKDEGKGDLWFYLLEN
jgi:hypothetical protein